MSEPYPPRDGRAYRLTASSQFADDLWAALAFTVQH